MGVHIGRQPTKLAMALNQHTSHMMYVIYGIVSSNSHLYLDNQHFIDVNMFQMNDGYKWCINWDTRSSEYDYVCIGQLADQACHRVDPPGATETEMHWQKAMSRGVAMERLVNSVFHVWKHVCNWQTKHTKTQHTCSTSSLSHGDKIACWYPFDAAGLVNDGIY